MLDTTLPRDDEGAQLFAAYEASRAQEHTVASRLLYPSRTLSHEAYMELLGDLRVVRQKCNEKMHAVRVHHAKMEENCRSGH